MSRKNLLIVVIVCSFQWTPTWAWNALGHRLIAQIAYDHLTPHAKRRCNYYNRLLNRAHKPLSLVNAAVWFDQLYAVDLRALKAWHYIDIPFSVDGTPLPSLQHRNAVWAIHMAKRYLLDADAADLDKAIALRILLHVVGDVHQPLHAASRISRRYPKGDHGGNWVLLEKNVVAKNLHAYWDRGGGLLMTPVAYHAADVRYMARQIEQRWPCHVSEVNLNPEVFANESHTLAVTIAYRLPAGSVPNESYQHLVNEVSQQRVALAGCRLAGILNQIYMQTL